MAIRDGVGTPRPSVEQVPSLTCGGLGTWKTAQTLTCDDGFWNGYGTLTMTRQWMRDTADIAGETAATYLLDQADETHKVKCRVTATSSVDDYGSTWCDTAQTITITA